MSGFCRVLPSGYAGILRWTKQTRRFAVMRTEYRHGERTRDLRAQRGWSQDHFAEVERIDVRTVQRLERDCMEGAGAVLEVGVVFGAGAIEKEGYGCVCLRMIGDIMW